MEYLIMVAVGFSVFVAGYFLSNFLSKDNGYPLEKELEGVLVPYIQNFIIASFEEAFESLEELERIVDGVDKYELVLKLYDYLPEEIGGYSLAFVQSVLTPEAVYDIFMKAYDLVKNEYIEHKDNFKYLFEDWKD